MSVSRRAAPPHFGHFTFTNSGTLASGDSPSAGKFRHRRKHHRQILVGNRHHPALLAVQHGNRRAPVALPRNAPVLQPENNFAFAESARFGVRGHFFDRFFGSEPRVRPRIHELAVIRKRRAKRFRRQRLSFVWLHDDRDCQPVLGRKFKVALVMRRNAHHRARSVFHQDEIPHPNRNLFAVEWIAGVPASEKSFFFRRRDIRRARQPPPQPLQVLFDLGLAFHARDQRGAADGCSGARISPDAP